MEIKEDVFVYNSDFGRMLLALIGSGQDITQPAIHRRAQHMLTTVCGTQDHPTLHLSMLPCIAQAGSLAVRVLEMFH